MRHPHQGGYGSRLLRTAGAMLVVLAALLPGSASPAERDYQLRWLVPPDPDVDHYNVHLGLESGVYDLVEDIGFHSPDAQGIASFVLPALDASLDYYIAMTAVDTSGNQSDLSNEILVAALEAECVTDADCSDADVCTGTERCLSGACAGGTSLDCTVAADCLVGVCDPVDGCQTLEVQDGASCDDADPGTENDACSAGVCVGQPIPPAVSLDGLGASPPAPQTVGTQVTLTASASGGGGALEYRWWVTTQAGSQVLRDWSPASTVVWTPTVADAQTQVNVWVREAGGGSSDLGSLTYPVSPPPECATNADCSDGDVCTGTERCVGGACVAGTPLTCTAPNACQVGVCDPASGCGTAPVQNGTTCDDGDARTENDACSAGVCVGQSVPDPITVSAFTVDRPSPQLPGTAITFTANASGGTGSLEYRWLVQDPSGAWTTVRAYGTSRGYTWTPTTAGEHRVGIWVRSVGSTDGDGEVVYYSEPFSVSWGPAIQVAPFAIDRPSPQLSGTAITFTANASGGAGSLEYRWLVRDPSGAWTMVRDYGTSRGYTWTPATAGEHRVGIWVRSVGSTDGDGEVVYYSEPFSVR